MRPETGLVAVLLVGLMRAVAVGGDCHEVGESCKVDGDCCSGVCRNGCRAAESTTTTTPAAVPTTSSTPPTAVPGSPTTTTLAQLTVPARFGPSDLGRQYPDSQELEWDPRDGSFANQYVRGGRVLTAWAVWYPELLRLARDTKKCRTRVPGLVDTWSEGFGKFVIHYSMRDWPESYGWQPNYVWDLWQGALDTVAGCTHAEQRPPGIALLLSGVPEPFPHGPKVTSRDHEGEFDPQRPAPPLTRAQCGLVREAHRVHALHVEALLARDSVGIARYPALIRATHDALAASARAPWEAVLIDLTFTGAVDPTRPQEEQDALTIRTERFHHAWTLALGCGADEDAIPVAPDRTLAWLTALGHARVHALRAVFVAPEDAPLLLRDVEGADPHCALDNLAIYDHHTCPETGW